MVSLKKKYLKRVLKTIGIVISVFVIVSSVATKFIYDFIFDRYDAEYNYEVDYSEEILGNSEKYTYKCGEHNLTGYKYNTDTESKGLVVIVPGFHSESADYAGIMHSFSKQGFDVFCFDSTGHGESGGESAIGFPQINIDLDATMDFIKSKFSYENIFLFGHSRGGYAACCFLDNEYDISGVISVNGVDSAIGGIMAYSKGAIGNVAYINYPFLKTYQEILFGRDTADIKACEVINETKVPVLIIQSEDDEELAESEFSLYSKKDEIERENVSFLLYDKDGFSGHTSVLYNESGYVNDDIIDISSRFFMKNS